MVFQSATALLGAILHLEVPYGSGCPMYSHAQPARGYRAYVISRKTGEFISYDLRSNSREVAAEWARCLAQSGRVELWHQGHLLGSFPPIRG